jgi:hypothetical protein
MIVDPLQFSFRGLGDRELLSAGELHPAGQEKNREKIPGGHSFEQVNTLNDQPSAEPGWTDR